MKQIILVLHSLAVGGAERHITTFANYFVGRDFSVILVFLDDPVVKFEIDPKVEIVCIKQNPKLCDNDQNIVRLFKAKKTVKTGLYKKIKLKVLSLFNRKKYNFVEKELFFINNYVLPLKWFLREYPDAIVVSFMTIPNISTMMAVKNLKNRALFCDFNDISSEYPEDSPINRLREKYYKRADAAIFQTQSERDYYTFLPQVLKYIVPNPLNSCGLPKRFEGERRKEIVNFCRLSKAKNLPLLIDAFALLNKDYPEYTLSIYGEGSLKESLLEQIASLNLEERVFIRDFDLNIHSKIVDCAMFVSSSDREGISNSMLEAMAVGLPCVCTDCLGGGARMMIEDGENGLLVPMKDANALYLAMKKIIENPALAEKLSQNAVKIRERLEPEKICGQMLSAILGE